MVLNGENMDKFFYDLNETYERIKYLRKIKVDPIYVDDIKPEIDRELKTLIEKYMMLYTLSKLRQEEVNVLNYFDKNKTLISEVVSDEQKKKLSEGNYEDFYMMMQFIEEINKNKNDIKDINQTYANSIDVDKAFIMNNNPINMAEKPNLYSEHIKYEKIDNDNNLITTDKYIHDSNNMPEQVITESTADFVDKSPLIYSAEESVRNNPQVVSGTTRRMNLKPTMDVRVHNIKNRSMYPPRRAVDERDFKPSKMKKSDTTYSDKPTKNVEASLSTSNNFDKEALKPKSISLKNPIALTPMLDVVSYNFIVIPLVLGVALLTSASYLVTWGVFLPSHVSGVSQTVTMMGSLLGLLPGFFLPTSALIGFSPFGLSVVTFIIGADLMLIGWGVWVGNRLMSYIGIGVFGISGIFCIFNFLMNGLAGAPLVAVSILINFTCVYVLKDKLTKV
jgi:hypothetical protein